MAEYLPPLVVEFQAKTAQFEAGLASVEGKLKTTGAAVDEHVGKLGKFQNAMHGVENAIAAVGIVELGKKLIEAGEKSEVADKRIGSIAVSMGVFGEKAGEVTERLSKMAETQSMATGVDANSIKMTEAKLLTFKNLASTADQAGGSFDRASKAAQDMAAAGFGTAESNAVKLGRALDNPATGISALTRVGVTFTAQEKEQIKSLMAHNDVLGAQQIILGKVETKFKGTAEATATASGKMGAGFAILQENLGKALLPIFDKVVGFINDKVMPVFQSFTDFLLKHKDVATALAVGLGALAAALAVATAVQWAMNSAMLASPITWIILGIAALIAGIVLLAMNWDKITKWIGDVWNGFMGWLGDSFKAIGKWWSDLWSGVGKFIQDWWPVLLGILTGGMSVAIELIIKNWGAIAGFFQTLWKNIAKFFVDGWNGIIGFLSSINKTIYDIGSNIVMGIWNGIKAAWGNLTTWVQGLFNGFIDGIKKLLGIHSPSTVFHGFGANLMQGLVNGIDSMKGAVTDSVSGVAGLVTDGFTGSFAMPGVSSAVGGSLATGGAISSAGYRVPVSNVSSSSSAVTIQTNVVANTNASPSQIAQDVVNAIKFNAPVSVGA
jgi:hypothetical protein